MAKKQRSSSTIIEKILLFLLSLGILIFFGFIIRNEVIGAFAFWYDPARDLLLGLDNINKLSLIGPPAGIPGLFYGPYWIWYISIAQLISKDPRWVVFFVQTLPYLVLFPLVLLFFKDISNKLITLMLWAIFIVSFQYYIQLWNPNLAPLLYLALLALLTRVELFTKNKIDWRIVAICGALAGLIMNFHISFGLGIVVSTGLVVLIEAIVVFVSYRDTVSKLILNRLIGIIAYGFGVLVIFAPFFLFEVRHGFNQINSVLFTLKRAVIDNSAVVGQVGLNKEAIFKNFYYPGAKLYHAPWEIVTFILAILFIIFLIDVFKKKNILTFSDKKILAILFINFIVLLTIYLKSRNPVWEYHFIGVEIIYLILLGMIAKKDKWIEYGLSVVALIMISVQIYNMVSTLNNPSLDENYKQEKYAIETIYNDKKDKDYTLTIYDPAIYTFNYDYIMKMKNFEGYTIPDKKVVKNKIAYLIVPKTDPVTKDAFINYNTPHLLYKTVKEWKLEDGTIVLRRELK